MESVWKWGCRGAIVVQWRHFMGMITHGISIGGIFRPIHQLLENLETWRLECDYGAVFKVIVLLVLPSLYNGQVWASLSQEKGSAGAECFSCHCDDCGRVLGAAGSPFGGAQQICWDWDGTGCRESWSFVFGDDVDTLGPTNINWFLFEHPFVEQDHHLPG